MSVPFTTWSVHCTYTIPCTSLHTISTVHRAHALPCDRCPLWSDVSFVIMSFLAGWVWKVVVVPSTIRPTVKLWLRLETRCGERTSILSRPEQSMLRYIMSVLYSACMACKHEHAYSFLIFKYPPSAKFYEPFGTRIKCSLGAAEDGNLNESCTTKAITCHHLNLALNISLCDDRYTWC
jgi:hypothetical protein